MPVVLVPACAPCPVGSPAAGNERDDQPAQSTQAGPLAAAEAAIDAKNYDKARGLLDAYLSAHSGDARALFDRGYCDDAQGRTQAAEGFYRKAIAADPKQFEARMALGLLLAQSGSENSKGSGRCEGRIRDGRDAESESAEPGSQGAGATGRWRNCFVNPTRIRRNRT